MKKTKKLLILVIAVIFCTSCGMFGLSDSAWSEVFEKRNSMPQNSLEEKLKNPEMVYQTVDGKLYAFPNTVIDDGAPLLWLRKDWIEKLGLKEPETACM